MTLLGHLKPSESIGQIEDLPKNQHISEVVNFIESNLNEFISEYKKKYSHIKIEKGLNQELSSFFNCIVNNEPFYFQPENMEDTKRGDSPITDIGVKTKEENIVIDIYSYSKRQTFFSIEAKRLGLTGKREKEYLIGHYENGKYKDCGGVERFKKGIHGSGLKYSAIIGYVQKNDFSFWFSKINCWIDELVKDEKQNIEWTKKGKLKKIYFKQKKAKLISKNKRREDYIFLYHFWIDLK